MSLLVLPAAVNAFGQGGDDRPYLDGAEAAKARKFADTFLHQLETARGIDLVPKTQFAPSFKDVVVAGDWKIEISDPVVPVTAKERLERSAMLFDFLYLRVLYASRGYKVAGDLELQDLYPPAVIKLMQKNSQFTPMLDVDFDVDHLSIAKPRKFFDTLATVNSEFRKYLNTHTGEWKNKYWLIVGTMNMNDDAKPFTYMCKTNECGGLPANTPVIRVNAFPFDLYLINQKGTMKLVKIAFISD